MRKNSNYLIGFASICAFVLIGFALQSYTAAPTGSTCVGGSYYVNSPVSPIYSGKIDTVAGTVLDSFVVSVGCKPTSITYTNNVWKVAGTPTVTVACYASADGGNSFGTTPITTYTVTPGSLTVPVTNTYEVNAPYGGNPYTTYKWLATNSASSTVSWQGSVLIR